MIHTVKKEGKMDALFDKVIKAIKEVGLPSIFCLALCAYIWYSKEDAKAERDALAKQGSVSQEMLLNTINKNTEAFMKLSFKLDKLGESVEMLSHKSGR